MKQLFVTVFLLSYTFANTQSQAEGGQSSPFFIPVERTIYYKLGDKTIPILIQQYGESTELAFVNLHANETTSVQAARAILETRGGMLIKIENGVQRVIRFRVGYMTFNLDPNRIFSRVGIRNCLQETGRIDERAINEAEKFGDRVLSLVGNANCIIALHNNTNEYYSVKTYLPGGNRQKDAKAVYANPDQDPDDIAFTTDSLLYQKMAERGYNSIWQDNINVKKDGSLSVWSGENNRRYINIETEHGRLSQYMLMLEDLLTILAEEKSTQGKAQKTIGE